MKSSRRLTVFLLRDMVLASDAISQERKTKSIELDPQNGLEGVFYFESRPSTAPEWVSFVQPLLKSDLSHLTSSSASGLLILKVDDHFFAFTFGYGRGFLNPSKIENRFGLKVVLNRLDPKQIRSLDTKTFEDMVVTKSTQVSKSSELYNFGVDISRDILRSVTGQSVDKSFAKRLSGSDALVVGIEISPTNLTSYCRKLFEAFEEETYKTNFGWIDNLTLVSDKSLIERLNDLIVDQLKLNDTSNSHMAVPESIAWEDIDAFKIAGTKKHEYDDLDLDQYLAVLDSERKAITFETLKSRKVSVRFGRSSDWDSRWSLYHCLISEQKVDDQLYVLIEGRWFYINESLVTEVNEFVSKLPSVTANLIASTSSEKEPDYNLRLAESSPSEFLHLDSRIIRPGGASSGIELCDVFTIDGEFLHIKRRSRSSTLSHLFAQGIISITTFLAEGTFREKIRAEVSASITDATVRARWLELIPEANRLVDRSQYSVSYVVIVNSSKSGNDWLPFFSKLNLMQCGRHLQSLGLKVALSRISVT